MGKRLSKIQIDALQFLRDNGPRSSYPGFSLGTMNSLVARSLASRSNGVGSFFSPQTAIRFTITAAGRAALTRAKGE